MVNHFSLWIQEACSQQVLATGLMGVKNCIIGFGIKSKQSLPPNPADSLKPISIYCWDRPTKLALENCGLSVWNEKN